MLKTTIVAGLATTILWLAPAFAQAPEGRFIAQQPNTSLRLSKLKGVDVIGQDHTKIGDIDDVLIDRDGRIQAVVLAVGGFLGAGGKTVAIPFGEILWNTGDVARVASPSASTTPGNTPSEAQAAAAGPETMPGANVSNQVLSAVPEGRSGTVDPGTGPVTTGAAGRAPATVPVVSAEGVQSAFVRLTQEDFRGAPEFRYVGQRQGRDTSAPAGELRR
jgi:sporulation protein YlmC with PRC-barrel domain